MHCYMKKELTILLCLLTAGTSVSAQKLTDHVNPFLGTATLWEPEDLGGRNLPGGGSSECDGAGYACDHVPQRLRVSV